jgi:3-hydroxyacyl-CoA dehydrogenase
MTPIRRVAVLGAGTMGARIAAHFANAGVPAILLDVDAATVKRGIDAALKSKAFYDTAAQSLVQPGTFDDLTACDWIIEAVTENLDVKRELLARVTRKPGAIISTNTSGIPLSAISEGFPPEFRQHFLGTHFFNPPRYLHLLELIRGADTLPAIADFVKDFAQRRLGKGVVECKDTPNFIGNRIGSFVGALVQKLTVEDDYTIEEVDLLTGPLIGMPKSASYRLLDIVGIDVWAHVTKNLGESDMTPFLAELVKRGWLGDKTGQGCYKKLPSGEILAIDWKTLEYHPVQKPSFPSVEAARNIENLPERLRFLVAAQDRAGHFIRTLLTETISYSRAKLPEIAYAPEDIDKAMRWGYNWTLGPFEIEDTLAIRPEPPERFIKKNAGASLTDLGDGVICIEFHSKMNALGEDALSIIDAALAADAQAIVIGNHGQHFSAGANLLQILLASQDEEWDELSAAINRFQQTTLAIKYSPIPVITAPFNLTLGGGAEIALHSARVQASAELYIGLVEVGVGLIPGAGGCKEMLIRNPQTAFEIIGYAKTSTSARDAFNLGYLRSQDAISMNPDNLIQDAKALAIQLSRNYAPPAPNPQIPTANLERMKLGLYIARQGEFISAYDAVIGEKLAHVLSGGGKPTATEQQLLDLEREAFLSLCGRRETQQRIQHMLKTGKALRN